MAPNPVPSFHATGVAGEGTHSTWNAQDADTDPDPTEPGAYLRTVERLPDGTRETWTRIPGGEWIAERVTGRGSWVEEHGPLFFVDAIAVVALVYVALRALGV